MKKSRISIPHRMAPRMPTQHPPTNYIGSLKAIMNQGRVPLSHYINQRPNKHNPTQTPLQSQQDKQRAMMSNGSREASLQKQLYNCDDGNGCEKMDVEGEREKLNEYLSKYQGTSKLVSYKNQLERKSLMGKERSRSVHANHQRPSTYKRLPPANLCQIQKASKPSMLDRVQTQQKLNEVVSKNGFIFCKFGKQVKKQKVDYRKFQVVLDGYDQIKILQLQQILGSGASATVRAARDQQSHQFAIKIYQKYKLVQPKRKKRVMHQIDILGKLDHPNIIKLTHCFEDKRQIHLLFQYIPGAKTLQEYIRENSYNVGERDRREIGVQVGEAIDYLHRAGVSHRDIKTDNVIIGASGQAKVIDFGFATTLTKGESHCGTPNYMAPELFEKKTIYDPTKVDSWAFAVLLFYLHEGTYPFKGYSEKQLSRNISACNYNFIKCKGSPRTAIEGAFVSDPGQRLSMRQILTLLKK